ncbi:MAG: Hpt domain-containing protein [Thermodesulfobacteriota bacterium]|nr:Hpt domain-containing protein [Thermodesulfobacteriota bacterium]
MEISKLAENIGLDVEEFIEIFEIYIESTNNDLEELIAAINSGDSEKAHEKSHSIKGASGNLGMDELFELAKQIDDQARNNSLNGLDKLVQDFKKKYEDLIEEFNTARE